MKVCEAFRALRMGPKGIEPISGFKVASAAADVVSSRFEILRRRKEKTGSFRIMKHATRVM